MSDTQETNMTQRTENRTSTGIVAATAIEHVDRKSKVLTPSTLGCLANVPVVNLAAGCEWLPLLLFPDLQLSSRK